MAFGGKTQYVWHIHVSHEEDRGLLAVEVGPREGGVMNWRIAVPEDAEVVKWGVGPAGNKTVAAPKRGLINGQKALLGSVPVRLFGAADRLYQGYSAYVVFRKDRLPPFVAFGQEDFSKDPPSCVMERITFIHPPGHPEEVQATH